MVLRGNIAEATGLINGVRKGIVNNDILAARIAAQFTRENRHEAIETVARDAIIAAALVRSAKTSSGSRQKHYLAKLSKLCAAYGATVLASGTAASFTLQLRFAAGKFATGAGAVFDLV